MKNDFGELSFYQIVNAYDNKIETIKLDKKEIKENNMSKQIPNRAIDSDNFLEVYRYYGHCYNKAIINIDSACDEFIDDISGDRYELYNGLVYSTLKLEK